MQLTITSPLSFFKRILLNLFLLFAFAMFVFGFYFLKNAIGISQNFELNISFILNILLKSIGLMFSLFFSYLFFIKIMISKKSLSKSNKNIGLFSLLLLANMLINEFIVYLFYNRLNLSLIIVNIISFLTLYLLNKKVKSKLIKKS
jgi:hypothetical protein